MLLEKINQWHERGPICGLRLNHAYWIVNPMLNLLIKTMTYLGFELKTTTTTPFRSSIAAR
jgi:hypothetical protein